MNAINSIAEFHRLLSLAEPRHPLVSVIDLAESIFLEDEIWKGFVNKFYCVALKREAKGKIRYGQGHYDYDKGVLSKELIAEVIDFAQEHHIPTVVDPKKRNFLNYQNATLFKPNLKELKEGLNIQFDSKDPAELAMAVNMLIETLEVKGAFVTLSEQGVFINFKDEEKHIPAHIRQIADVSGAGDTVISIAACCVALNLSPELVAGLSNLGGGLVCESVGVVPINKERLLAEAQQNYN